jgi:hypothetical protein
MIQLKTENYYKVLEPLQEVAINHLFARTVLEQKMDGEVYVDNPEQPSVFYVKHRYGMSLLFGKTNNPNFNCWLANYLLNNSAGEWLQVFPAEWNDKLAQFVGGNIVDPANSNPEKQQIIRWSRVNFRFDPSKYPSTQSAIPEGFKLTRTNAVLFGELSGSVIPSCFWRNGQEFAENAIGFSLLYDGQPVSTAFASFIHGQQLEIGIETKTGFRGEGLAQITCSALIGYCLENNFEPIWSCRLENTGSYMLAKKLGFEPRLTIPYYQLPAKNKDDNGVSAFQHLKDQPDFPFYLHRT